jgi:hypothetical protein
MISEFQITLNLKEMMRLNALIAEYCGKQDPNGTMPEDLVSLQRKITDAMMGAFAEGG